MDERLVAFSEDQGALHLRDRRPLYVVAAEALRELITQSRLAPGDHLPPERELSELLGIGRSTLREALRYLQMAGVVKTIHGRGTVVTLARDDVVAGLEQLASLESLAKRQGWKCGTIDLSIERWSLERVEAEELERESGSTGTKIVRVKTRDGTPIAVMESVVPEDVVSYTDLRRSFRSSIIEFFLRRRNPVLDHARSHVRVGATTPALADRLDVEIGVPLLILDELFVDSAGAPFCLNVNSFVSGTIRLDLVRRPP